MPHHKPGSNAKPKSRSGRQKRSKPRRNSKGRPDPSPNARRRSGQGVEPLPRRNTRRSENEEKRAYDNFFTYLPLNAWLYNPRNGPVPSFPRTDDEISQLVREPTQADIDELAEDIAAGRFRVNIEEG